MSFSHLLDDLSVGVAPVVVVIALPAWGYGLLSQIRSRRAASPVERRKHQVRFFIAMAIFAGSILFEFLLTHLVVTAARDELRAHLSQEISDVEVDGKPISEAPALVATLRDMDQSALRAHHSHPTTRLHLNFRSRQGDFSLSLGRDSGNPREYWVFDPDYKMSSTNDLGRIVTPQLDEFR